MATSKRAAFVAQLTCMDTVEHAATVKAWAEHVEVTQGDILRDVIVAGLPLVIKALKRNHGDLPSELYAAHLAAEAERGQQRAVASAQQKRAERVEAQRLLERASQSA